jgi:GTPase
VGYTNAGKSTLLNALTRAGVIANDRLFATLDPRTRRFALPGGEPVLVSDTVGFVRKLPHQLVEAFRSTLEVVNETDLLVHLVDSAAPDPEDQIDTVRAVLGEIGAGDVAELLVFNKADVAPLVARELAGRFPGSVIISAARGQGVDELVEAVAYQLHRSSRVVELSVPYSRGDVLAALHREGEVLEAIEGEGATMVRAKLPVAALAQFVPFMSDGTDGN